jgi:hypothetical protein
MNKEQLQKELQSYKTLYNEQKEEKEKLLQEREDIESYKKLNLALQIQVARLQKEKEELTHCNIELANQNDTYKEVFDILKEKKN